MGLCRGEGSVIHPREKGRYPMEGLADDLQELGVVLVASQILNVEQSMIVRMPQPPHVRSLSTP